MRRDSACEVRSPDEPASTVRVSRASDTRVAWSAPRRVSRPRVTFNTFPRVARSGFFLARDSSASYFFHIYRKSRLNGLQDFLNVHRGGRHDETMTTKKKKRAKESSRTSSSSCLSIVTTLSSRPKRPKRLRFQPPTQPRVGLDRPREGVVPRLARAAPGVSRGIRRRDVSPKRVFVRARPRQRRAQRRDRGVGRARGVARGKRKKPAVSWIRFAVWYASRSVRRNAEDVFGS